MGAAVTWVGLLQPKGPQRQGLGTSQNLHCLLCAMEFCSAFSPSFTTSALVVTPLGERENHPESVTTAADGSWQSSGVMATGQQHRGCPAHGSLKPFLLISSSSATPLLPLANFFRCPSPALRVGQAAQSNPCRLLNCSAKGSAAEEC